MIEHWQTALHNAWGIDAELTRLDGEYDLNFRVTGMPGYVFKVMRAGCAADFIDMQVDAIDHVLSSDPTLPVPPVVPARNGSRVIELPDPEGKPRLVWLLGLCPGKTYADVRPHSAHLVGDVGMVLGRLGQSLADFNAAYLQRDFKWNLTKSAWIGDHLKSLTDPARRELVADILNTFRQIEPVLAELPSQAIHNDANDYNLLVTAPLNGKPEVTGLVDFGDMCAAPRICELAIAGAYAVLDHPDPEKALCALVAGYHATNPLSANEIDLLWPLLRLRLAVSVVNSTLMALENPDDPYVTISQAPAWRFLKGNLVDPELIGPRLRAACGLPVTDAAPAILSWLEAKRGTFAPLLGCDLSDLEVKSLAVERIALPQNPFDITAHEAHTVGAEPDAWFLGHYCEPRLIYTDGIFRKGPWKNSDRRTVHIAVDVFAPAGSPLYSPAPAIVVEVVDRPGHLDYGGVVVLRHEAGDAGAFYTLHGHLDPTSIADLHEGQQIAEGQAFARLGDPSCNGGWAPHVHFQLAIVPDRMHADWPGVADPDELALWEGLCPNPAALLNLPDTMTRFVPTDRGTVAQSRKTHFGANLRLSYDNPAMLVRGWKHHLFDEWGRPYLDAYNNVPHVGHAHPRIQAVAAEQLTMLNTNTRYLHRAQTEFAEKLLSKLPDPLSVCFFVNSGTEANELALRLARAHTSGRDMITPDHGYHGNTTGAIDISAYKFNAKGGVGQPDWVHLVEVADDYRGTYRRDDPDRGARYAAQIDPALDAIRDRRRRLAGFIAETYPSVGGQIIPPPGYLKGVYQRIRAAGGLCIADEVQTGLGRLGDYYFAFEEQGVVPDIVVLGKPIGNGHPLGVVVTTREIADSFAQGPEFFSTFGGSTLSCRIGKEVLDIVDDEGLMENARIQGAALKAGLIELAGTHACIGDVRGRGLFLGVDLVTNRDNRAPATDIANRLKNRLRDRRVLIGSEGPADNILKVRPPLTIDEEGTACFLAIFSELLDELPGAD